VKEEKRHGFPFLLASADVAAQAAGALLVHPSLPVWLEKSLNLAHLAISYYTQPAHYFFPFCVCLFRMRWFVYLSEAVSLCGQ